MTVFMYCADAFTGICGVGSSATNKREEAKSAWAPLHLLQDYLEGGKWREECLDSSPPPSLVCFPSSKAGQCCMHFPWLSCQRASRSADTYMLHCTMVLHCTVGLHWVSTSRACLAKLLTSRSSSSRLCRRPLAVKISSSIATWDFLMAKSNSFRSEMT